MRAVRCPNCGGPLTPEHTRDTGDLAVRPEHACPWLFDRRQGVRRAALDRINAELQGVEL